MFGTYSYVPGTLVLVPRYKSTWSTSTLILQPRTEYDISSDLPKGFGRGIAYHRS